MRKNPSDASIVINNSEKEIGSITMWSMVGTPIKEKTLIAQDVLIKNDTRDCLAKGQIEHFG